MTMFICPLCHKHSSTTSLDIDSEPDIVEVTYGSHGRGKIYVESKESVLDKSSDTAQAVASKVLRIIEKLIDANVINGNYVASRLGLDWSYNMIITKLTVEKEEYKSKYDHLDFEQRIKREEEEKEKRLMVLIREMMFFFKYKLELNEEDKIILELLEVNDNSEGFIEWFKSLKFENRSTLLSRVKVKNPQIQLIINIIKDLPTKKSIIGKLIDMDPQ